MNIINNDCLLELPKLESNSVDLILTDPPYGTTHAKWDSVIPFDQLWPQLWRVLKDDGVIIMFAAQPFTSDLIYSQRKHFKYTWIWMKEQGTGQLNAKKRPMMQTEDICVFYKKFKRYYPQMRDGKEVTYGGDTIKSELYNAGEAMDRPQVTTTKRYPTNILKYNRPLKKGLRIHPTQKPVPLLEELIKTYTHEGETVLDFSMGSGSCGIACLNTDRNFIGMELEKETFEKSKNWLDNHSRTKSE